MTGLQSILDYINEESEQQIKGIRSEAKARVEAMEELSRRQTEEECERIRLKADAEEDLILERGRASAELRRKQLLLSARQELITETLSYCLEELSELPEEEYAAILKKLLLSGIRPGKAVLYMNKRDLSRMRERQRQELISLALDAGNELTISEEPRDIRGGLILGMGDIEENLSFESIFADREDDIRDVLSRVLFS